MEPDGASTARPKVSRIARRVLEEYAREELDEIAPKGCLRPTAKDTVTHNERVRSSVGVGQILKWA